MNIQDLLNLSEGALIEYHIADREEQFFGCSVLENSCNPDSNTIYIAQLSDLFSKDAEIIKQLRFLIITLPESIELVPFIKNISESCNILLSSNNIIQTKENVDNILTETARRQQRTEALTQSFLSDTDIKHFIRSIAKQIGNPVAIVLFSGETIATQSAKKDITADSPFGFFWHDLPPYQNYYCSHTRGSELDKLGLSSKEHLVTYYNTDFQMNILDAIIRIGNDAVIGRLLVYEYDRPFIPSDSDLAMLASSLCGKLFRKETLSNIKDKSNAAQLIQMLINNDNPNPDLIQHFLSQMRFSFSGCYYFIMLKYINSDMTDAEMRTSYEFLSHNLLMQFSKGFSAIINERLVFVFDMDNKTCLSNVQIKTLESIANLTGMSIGISMLHHSLIEAKNAYAQASIACDSYSYRNKGLTFFDNIYYEALIHHIPQPIPSSVFVDSTLLHLCLSKKEANIELCYTLYCYLYHGQNSAKTAEALIIHRNTLLYRIGRIKEILQSELTNGDDISKYYYSFKILESMKLIAAPK